MNMVGCVWLHFFFPVSLPVVFLVEEAGRTNLPPVYAGDMIACVHEKSVKTELINVHGRDHSWSRLIEVLKTGGPDLTFR